MSMSRREFLKSNTAAALGVAAGGAFLPEFRFPPSGPDISRRTNDEPVRIAILGTGNRGRGLMEVLLGLKGVEFPALCDIQPANLERAREMVVKAGRKIPEGYGRDETDYKRLLERDDIDAVIIASYWEWHTPMAVDAMTAGKYAGVEVPAAYTLEECWELVKTHEATKVPCMMLENWSFRRDNLAVLNMIRKGLLGEIVHCHCAHSHDCIDHWFFDPVTGLDRWAAKYLLGHNRDQYPTHQQGPVLSWMDIGCGDYYDHISSTATDCFGINDYFIRRFGPGHPNAHRKYKQGDIVSSVVRTKKGKSIVINYDMQLPRPYDNRWMIQGNRGLYDEDRGVVYLTGRSPQYHQWEPFGPYQELHEHKWWKAIRSEAGQFSHGGTDTLELRLFVEAVRNRTQTPLDVYDAALMSANGPLSEESITKGGAPVPYPDFTSGRWQTTQPRFAVE
ncbi:MAG: nagA 3 [Candidatus Aminicenantes bacterium]|nr:nagA 3 [Candidatus Aminicenantes bacterium]